MVERIEDALSETFKAAGDPTRRGILTLLAQNGPTRVTEIAQRFDMSLNAVSKHIKVLERAGLVARKTIWRAHYIEIDLAPLAAAFGWFAGLRSIWALRLDALAETLTKEAEDGRSDDDRTDDRTDPDAQPGDPGARGTGV
jgi:DNA-binding transcriptional ArsR family regulator